MATFEILDELTKVVGSSRLQDHMKRLSAKLEALGERGDVVRSLDHMREIVARDSTKVGVSEQLLAGAHVGMGLKEGYVVDMEEND
nr:hypothetical protein [Tanacetum cinerariifolium]